jgi:CheY-like chemotaxis protein
MSVKLRNVLLIDDDSITNFLHQTVLSEAKIAEKVVVTETVTEALQFLKTEVEEEPELIFLDLNLPGLSGWDFIEEYRKIKSSEQPKSVLVILTTSMNPEDHKKADSITEVAEFRRKPMTVGMVNEIAVKYFKR